MINTKLKNEVIESLVEDSNTRFKENLADLDLVGFMQKDDVDLVKNAVNKIKANVIASIPEGIPVPGTSLYVSCTGTESEITVINLSINNKIKAEKTFKFAKSFISDDAIVKNIGEFFVDVYSELVLDIMAEDNLEQINALISDAAGDVGYKVSLASVIGGSDKKILFISDDEVVFNADLDRVFAVDDILALQEPDEEGLIKEEDIEAAKKQIKEVFEVAQTPVQLIENHGGVFISYFANISKTVKPMTLIKQVTGWTPAGVKNQKNAVCYYSEGDVYALIAKREGKLEVLLSPFNTETFRNEKVDVLKAIEK